jgi:glutamine---fructose-6-phosphate transaminase (isomerizing)
MHAEASEGGAAVGRFCAANSAALVRIGKRLRASPPSTVVTCARGSSDHAATYAKYMIETLLGVPTASAALSVASIYQAAVASRNIFCIAISQSGRSADLLSAVLAYKESGAFVVALVNDAESPLAALADEALPLMAGLELSVAATKSYITSLAAIAALIGEWSQHKELLQGLNALPAQLATAFECEWPDALPIFQDATNLFVIGRGYGMAVAQEAALKLKETCGLHAEAFSSAEVRHGPMAIVGERFPVLAFATSDIAGDGVRAVADEFDSRGAHVCLIDARSGRDALSGIVSIPMLEPILMIQSFYRFANVLSLSRGFIPDLPPHLNKVTSTQ